MACRREEQREANPQAFRQDRRIPGIEVFRYFVDVDNPYPLSFLDQYSLAELSAELAIGPFAGQLLLQALGLGGWIYNGIDRLTVLGAAAIPKCQV